MLVFWICGPWYMVLSHKDGAYRQISQLQRRGKNLADWKIFGFSIRLEDFRVMERDCTPKEIANEGQRVLLQCVRPRDVREE